MIRGGYLDAGARQDLLDIARDGSVAHGLARRANALVLLDDGMSCMQVACVLLLDDDTVRTWHQRYMQDGVDSLVFGHKGGFCRLSTVQFEQLSAWAADTLPRTTRQVGAYILAQFGVVYESRSGLVKLLHRLGLEHRKPRAIARRLDPARQAAFIAGYNDLLNHLEDDEAVLFADAVHPVHAAQPVGCWAPKGVAVAVAQTTGREHINIHGAIDLETGCTVMRLVDKVDADSTIELLKQIEATYPRRRRITVFMDNARCHHSRLVRAWLARPDCRIRLRFVPPYSPHLNPIERLWGLMHKHVTHNKSHASIRTFQTAVLTFLRYDVPRQWSDFCDQVTDNFRIIDPNNFRVIG
jgi:transposase